jgi:hypothetical protein
VGDNAIKKSGVVVVFRSSEHVRAVSVAGFRPPPLHVRAAGLEKPFLSCLKKKLQVAASSLRYFRRLAHRRLHHSLHWRSSALFRQSQHAGDEEAPDMDCATTASPRSAYDLMKRIRHFQSHYSGLEVDTSRSLRRSTARPKPHRVSVDTVILVEKDQLCTESGYDAAQEDSEEPVEMDSPALVSDIICASAWRIGPSDNRMMECSSAAPPIRTLADAASWGKQQACERKITHDGNRKCKRRRFVSEDVVVDEIEELSAESVHVQPDIVTSRATTPFGC